MHVTELVTEHRILMEHFNRTEYPDYFHRYRGLIAPYFEHLQREDVSREVAALLDRLEGTWSGHLWKFRREAAQEDDKQLLLLFLAPAAMDIGTDSSVAFAETLAAQWNERYPDSPFKVGNFAAIQDGFRWKPKIPGTNKDLF